MSSNNSNRYKVFVYGSLKEGFGNSYLLKDSEFLGDGHTINGGWYMLSLGGFPGVVKIPAEANTPELGYHIYGEVYVVDESTLKSLDALESNGSFYKREVVEVDTGDETVYAWMYVLISPTMVRHALTNHCYDGRVLVDEESRTMCWE